MGKKGELTPSKAPQELVGVNLAKIYTTTLQLTRRTRNAILIIVISTSAIVAEPANYADLPSLLKMPFEFHSDAIEIKKGDFSVENMV